MEFSTISSVVASQKFGSDKNKTLAALINYTRPTSSDISNLVKLYSFDDDRNDALKIICQLKNLYISSEDITKLCGLYTYDSNRNEAIKIISSHAGKLTSSDFKYILKLYKYDSDRNYGLGKLDSHIDLISTSDFTEILGLYKYESEKNIAIQYLKNKFTPFLINELKDIKNTADPETLINYANKIDLPAFLSSLEFLEERVKLLIMEKNIGLLNLYNNDTLCPILKQHFQSVGNFNQACDILGINPDTSSIIEEEMKIEKQTKIEINKDIIICGNAYNKSMFEVNKLCTITILDITVIIINRGNKFDLKVTRNGNISICSAELDAQIVIQKSNGFMIGTLTRDDIVHINI
jgi:hypothetical protein